MVSIFFFFLPYYSEYADHLAMVFGQKNFRLVRIMQRATGDITLQYKSEVVELADWILDVKWLRWTNPDNYEIILVTTHNVLVSYKVSNKASECKYYCSEVSCILYPVLANKSLLLCHSFNLFP